LKVRRPTSNVEGDLRCLLLASLPQSTPPATLIKCTVLAS
jgi:hypothetical protein